ncbi:MAG: biotin--[acetyl-CoA-carboxylase] ligase [Planctomycetales bacterium]|jgi:BirA family biotin operon repressor/biotin-[acetyl-CoA-carboxylase] ligase
MAISADYTSRWFDLERLLDESFVREIEFRRECVSTNDLALSPTSDRTSPTLVLTDSQTGGRGRGSNQWWARDGALTFSLRLQPSEFSVAHENWPLVSLTTAIAVADTLSNFAPEDKVGLKWPNDVFLNGRKICGILVEPPKGSTSELVIGVGINVANSLSEAPDEVRAIATSIYDETDTDYSPSDVLLTFLQRFEVLIRELGTASLNLKDRWQQQCTLTGQRISLESGDHQIVGLCHGIADNGAINVETDGVIRPWFGGIVRPIDR